MPTPDQPPIYRPIRHPYRCDEHIDWPLSDSEHVVVDHGEVLHVGPEFQVSYGIHDNAEAVAEETAEALAFLRETIRQITPSQMRSMIEFFTPKTRVTAA